MQRTEFKLDKRIAIYGSRRDRDIAAEVLRQIPKLRNLSEAQARLKIQDIIDQYHLKAHILFDGNRVWSRNLIMRNVQTIVRTNDMKLSKYFYEFLHLTCGSIAHFHEEGWVWYYPTVEALRDFFRKNEFGKPVRNYIPEWRTDAKRIVENIEQLLKIQ